MIGFLSRKRRQPFVSSAPAAVPDGMRIYAIGDVHGRLDLLVQLMALIESDNRGRAPADTQVVMLGDLIDRGAQSAEVIEYLLRARPEFASFHFLMGNHEEAMLLSLAEHADPREIGWMSYGGRETLDSYGVPDKVMEMSGWMLSDEIRRYIPKDHQAFVASFHDHLRFGDYLFVHAGIRPGVALERQKRSDLLWIRSAFLEDETDHGFTVVHGHTITGAPQFRSNRIGIDTGAYRTGTLTALGLEGSERWLLSTETAE